MKPLRVLVTGSRDWTDKAAIAQALLKAIGDYGPHLIVRDADLGSRVLWSRVVVVHGGARGADTIAGRIATNWHMAVEVHNADWDRYGIGAGPRRNAAMVAAGADVCLAFPLGASRGTRDCQSPCHPARAQAAEAS